MAMGLYDGSSVCSGLTLVTDSDPNAMTVTGLTVGTTYYLRVWDYGNDQFGSFDLCGRYTTATISDNHIEGFKYFPNPVNDVLNMTAKDNIEDVSIFGITGQEVIHITPNTLDAHIHINHLKNGIYFVKVQVNGQVTAFKIIKK